MNSPIKTLVALDIDANRDSVLAALPTDTAIEVLGVIEGLEESWATIQESAADLLVVACGAQSERALYLIEAAVRQRPDRPVVVLYTGSPNGFVRRAFEAGADDLVTLPGSSEEVRFALEKAVARRQGAGAIGVATGSLICVLGPKGGTGKTLTSCNVAVALAARGQRVAMVDLDLQFGDVGLSLGLSPERTMYDLAKTGGSIDAEKLDGYLTTHESGVRVLLAPARPDHAGSISVAFLQDVYATLRSMHDFVIVDTPPGFTPEVIATIDSSTHLCMVGMLDSLSLKNTKLGLETLELMGFDAGRMTVVLNRADSRVGITKADVADVIGREPDVFVPSDRDIPRSVNAGSPILASKPRSGAAQAYAQLAGHYLQGRNGSGNGNDNGNRKRRRFRRAKG